MENILQANMAYLETQDSEIAALVESEYRRQKQNIELIASENIASPAVIAAMSSILTNKYAEGLPGRRYYGGCEYVDDPAQRTGQSRAVDDQAQGLPQLRDVHVGGHLVDQQHNLGLKIVPLEGLDDRQIDDCKDLQDCVLTIHHSFMQTLSSTNALKIVENHAGQAMIINASQQA